MADVDIDPFGEHDKTESRPDEPTGENIHLTPVGGSTWEPEREQETSFGGKSQRIRMTEERVKGFIISYLKAKIWLESQKNLTLIISTSEIGNCTTKA